RSKHYHALLDLETVGPAPAIDSPSPTVSLRPARVDDFAELEPVFSGAFHSIQPFGSLDDAARREAARKCLQKTRTGGDGPWVAHASFVAEDDRKAVGAILLTLLPEGDPCDWDSYYWREPPPDDCVERRLGRPHLTWIFVSPWSAGHGVGTAL